MNRSDTVLITGPSCCGKTYILLHELPEKEYRMHFDFILIFSPNLLFNSIYTTWKYLDTDTDVIALHTRTGRLNTMLQHITYVYTASRTAVVIADMSDSNEQHNNHNALSHLGYSGRYHNFTLFILSQKVNWIATGLRGNTTRVMYFTTHNRRSEAILKGEFLGSLTRKRNQRS